MHQKGGTSNDSSKAWVDDCLRPFVEPRCLPQRHVRKTSMLHSKYRTQSPGQNGDSERVQVPAVPEQLLGGLPEADVRTRERPGGVPTDLSRRVLYIIRTVYLRGDAK